MRFNTVAIIYSVECQLPCGSSTSYFRVMCERLWWKCAATTTKMRKSTCRRSTTCCRATRPATSPFEMLHPALFTHHEPSLLQREGRLVHAVTHMRYLYYGVGICLFFLCSPSLAFHSPVLCPHYFPRYSSCVLPPEYCLGTSSFTRPQLLCCCIIRFSL